MILNHLSMALLLKQHPSKNDVEQSFEPFSKNFTGELYRFYNDEDIETNRFCGLDIHKSRYYCL